MKTFPLAFLTLILGLSLPAARLHGQDDTYYWTGEGDNGNWSNADNWNPVPDFNTSTSPNSVQNGYIFIFEGPNQPDQNTGSSARFRELHFKGGDFTLTTSGQVVFGKQDGGITVDSDDITLHAGSVAMSVFRNKTVGGLTVNDGTLLLDVAGNVTVGGSEVVRYLPVDGNGTITLQGTMIDSGVGGGLHLKSTFSGRLILNTGGSTLGTIGGGTLSHAGTGILELRANDAAGVLPFEFLNSQAAIEAGGGARTLQNAVKAHTGFRVTGSHALGLAGTLDLGMGSQTIEVVETGGALILQSAVTGSGGTFTKTGEGRLVIESDNTAAWSQTVAIDEGELHVANQTGLATGSGLLIIGADGHLSGASGRVGTAEIVGTVHLESTEVLTFAGDLSMQAGSGIVMTYGAGAALLEGDLDLAEGVTLSLDGSGWAPGETYRLFNLADGSITGELSFSGPYLATFFYQSGEEGYIDFQLAAIPEPSGVLLGTIAFALAAATLRRRKTNALTF
ncbi:MAG TPA: hypothetical protein VNQ90_04175 [Chthoniobacteraceae bacterium]|nr:hypothetical protein [Chthoniobacteraceae bacterium]